MSAERLKYFLRSRSLRFTRDHYSPYRPAALSTYRWNGQQIWYRPGSSDTEIIYKILLKRGRKGEYAIDPEVQKTLGPIRTVLDIGAHIGVASLYLSHIFREARVFAFEPVADNFALLERNTRGLARVRQFPVALGERNGTIELWYSDARTNFGGFSRAEAGSDVQRKVSVELREAGSQLAELGIDRADVVKIDVEGSEWEVLTALGMDFLCRTKFLMGELHGRRDFDLLGMLSGHFRIAVKKNLDDRCFMFQAVNRNLG